MDTSPSLTGSRRIAQASWILLVLYTFFGGNLEDVVPLTILGISIPIRRGLLTLGILMFSFYAAGLYYYYAFIIGYSPGKWRKLVMGINKTQIPSEIFPKTRTLPFLEFIETIKPLFPCLDYNSLTLFCVVDDGEKERKRVVYRNSNISPTETYQLELPSRTIWTHLWIAVSNFHYHYPFWFNVVALVMFFLVPQSFLLESLGENSYVPLCDLSCHR